MSKSNIFINYHIIYMHLQELCEICVLRDVSAEI